MAVSTAMVHLEHLFAAGLRFDTEIQYLVRSAGRRKYERLPLRQSSSARACTLTSALQCVAVLLQVPLKQAAQRLKRVIPTAGEAIDSDSLLLGIRAFDKAVCAEPLHSTDAQEIGEAVLGALRVGHLCLMQFESKRFCRWATVTGVALDRTSGNARALLLLDSGMSGPWACAHNVRIELQAVAGKSVHASEGFTLNCRDLLGRRLCRSLARPDRPPAQLTGQFLATGTALLGRVGPSCAGRPRQRDVQAALLRHVWIHQLMGGRADGLGDHLDVVDGNVA